ncbi:MAG: isoprenylcysteine carboxylmethyltransferase family protein [Planctomycetes bacterium]|nr:isoprenylcysteine carboxylmethyltransferase family protein [Planctomycetota bacterium]
MALDALAFRFRAPLLVLAAAPLVWAALAASPPDLAALTLGAALALAGAGLRLASIRWLGKRARVSRAKVTILVARGPYARVRNPLYLAALLVVAGLGLMAGLGAWALAPTALVWLVYARVVRHEERALLAAHGPQGAAYLRAVPRWLPLLMPRLGPEVEREPWAEVLRREWRLLLGIPLALAGLAALALTPAGAVVRGGASDLARALGAPLPVLVAAGAALGALGNGLKTEHDLARKARRRARDAASLAEGARAGTGS